MKKAALMISLLALLLAVSYTHAQSPTDAQICTAEGYNPPSICQNPPFDTAQPSMAEFCTVANSHGPTGEVCECPYHWDNWKSCTIKWTTITQSCGATVTLVGSNPVITGGNPSCIANANNTFESNISWNVHLDEECVNPWLAQAQNYYPADCSCDDPPCSAVVTAHAYMTLLEDRLKNSDEQFKQLSTITSPQTEDLTPK